MNPLRRFWRSVLDDGAPPTRQQQAEQFRRDVRQRARMQRVTVLSATAQATGPLGPHDLPTTTVVVVALLDGTRRTVNIYDWEPVTDRFPAGMSCSLRIPMRSRPLTDQLVPPVPGPLVTPWAPHEPPGDDDFTADLLADVDDDGSDRTRPLLLAGPAFAQRIVVDSRTAGAVDGTEPAGWAGLVRVDPATGLPTRVGLYRKPWLAFSS